jgi:hypothetical protein
MAMVAASASRAAATIGDEWFASADPDDASDAEERDGWKVDKGSDCGGLRVFEHIGDGEDGCEQEE